MKANFKEEVFCLRSRIIAILFISACILAGSLLGLYYQDKRLLSGGIAENIQVEQISLSDLDPAQALALLERQYSPLLRQKLTLTYKEMSWEVDPERLGVELDLEKVVEAAYRVGRQGGLWQRFQQRIRVRREGLILKPELKFNQAKVSALGSQLASQIHRTAKNAQLQVKGTEVYVVPSVTGRRLVVEKLPGVLFDALLKSKRTVTVPVEEINPKLTTEIVKGWGIQGQVAGFSTRFNVANTNRVKNIRISAGKLDGHIVMRGEEFSFNRIVGTRGVKEGYTEAPVIIGGKLVPGVGGGVCQVSSTLYNALLFADLKPTKRSHHSMPVAYLPIGRDAAVAYDYIDLRFKNTSGSALLFKTSVEGDRLRVAIFGSRTDKVVDLESTVEEEILATVEEKLDLSLAPGHREVVREGASGYKVSVWRTVTRRGKLIKRELVSKDYYRPVTKLVAVGPPKVEPEQAEGEGNKKEG